MFQQIWAAEASDIIDRLRKKSLAPNKVTSHILTDMTVCWLCLEFMIEFDLCDPLPDGRGI